MVVGKEENIYVVGKEENALQARSIRDPLFTLLDILQ
jgi:hypothetical protein